MAAPVLTALFEAWRNKAAAPAPTINVDCEIVYHKSMVTTHDLEIYSVTDFENLPDDGLWEVADGRAILLPGNEIDHQEIASEIHGRLTAALAVRGHGRVLWTVNLDIPPYPGEAFRTRVPDLVVFENRPFGKRFGLGQPPQIAIEILATRRGNVERTEKIDDYARAGVGEYWLVDPFERCVERYRLADGRYAMPEIQTEEIHSLAMPGLHIDLRGLFDSE
jgi:Uma2 family endonuclease